MTAQEQLDYLRDQAMPKLGEGGLEAYVVTGYLRLESGKLQRVVIAKTGEDAAFEDALAPVVRFAQMWGASPSEFVPRDPGDGEPKSE